MPKVRIDRGSVGAEWARRGFTCDLWVESPGKTWADFVHDVDELLLVVDGCLLVEFGGRVLRLDPGDELLLPAGTRHTLRCVGEHTVRWLYGHRGRCGLSARTGGGLDHSASV